jgi:hypothetical protein
MAKGNAALLVALGGLKKPKSSDSDDESSSDAEESMPDAKELEQQASEDVFDALKSEDREGFREALGRFVKACTSREEADEY